MNANSAKSGIGSIPGPTVTTSVKTVEINDGEHAVVSAEASENWYVGDPVAVRDAAQKCSHCKLVTVQQGYEFQANLVVLYSEQPLTKRVYLCTNCGKFSSK